MPDEPNEPTSPQNEPEPTDAPDASSDAGGDLSQADIDAALNQTPAGDAAPPPAADDAGGELSQADIDAALAGASAPDAAQAPPEAAESPQDDIDALLAAAESLTSPGDADSETAGNASAPEEVLLDSAGRPFDEAAAAMAAAIAEDAAAEPQAPAPASQSTAPSGPAPTPFELKDFSADTLTEGPHDISILRDVDLKVHIELGRTKMYIEDVLKLTEGSVVELDNLAGDPVNIYVNDRLVARGEVLVLSDNFCVRISEILSGPQNVAVA